MVDHPRLTYTDGSEAALDATVESSSEHSVSGPSRKTFPLSTRGNGLVVDELGYDEREEIAPVTARTLLLTEGARVTNETADPVELVPRLRCPGGGKRPMDREIERVAAYLRSAAIEQRAVWLATEIVEDSRLSAVMEPEEVGTQRDRMNGLRGIAKDL